MGVNVRESERRIEVRRTYLRPRDPYGSKWHPAAPFHCERCGLTHSVEGAVELNGLLK
jgi:hypothetical protein